MHKIKVAPSMLSCDFSRLGDEVKACEEAGADIIHIDVMDGHFVPNITIGPLIVEAIRKCTSLPLDCHLMINDPDKYIQDFVQAGADMISVHVECLNHLHRTLKLIKSYKINVGIALNPVTPLSYAYEAAEYCDFILLMSVNPGFGGQAFIQSFLNKSKTLRNYLDSNNLTNVEIEVDGGIKIENVTEVVQAGANILVSGSGLFNGSLNQNIIDFKKNAESSFYK